MAISAGVVVDERGEPRDEVHHRARGTRANGTPVELVVVNMSARGMMARTTSEFAVGERLRVKLPAVGGVSAEVRWSLGGRIGCQLDRTIPLADYFQLLAAIARPA